MSVYRTVLAACVLLLAVSAEIVRYDGHKVISVQPTDMQQVKWLSHLHHTSLLDFWTHPSLIRPTDIRVSPEEFQDLMEDLAEHGLNVTIIHDDVQKLIEGLGQHPHSKNRRQVNLSARTVIGGFPRYNNIYHWALNQQETFSDVMSLESIGRTYEGRDQWLIKIGKPGVNKPIIWLDAAIHAREWLSVSTALNIVDKMLKGYAAKDPVITALLTDYDWYIVPVANPDGYEYSHTSGGRLWRKTRSPQAYGSIGADPNRNWGYYWCVTGSSHVSTSDQFCGPSAWSEKCVMNMKTKLEAIAPRLKVFITLHSYGQMWFVPYAWSRVAYPRNYRDLIDVSTKAVAAMQRTTGAVYKIGRVPDLLYEASGSSMDWVMGTLGTPYVFGMELRPGMNIPQGFITSTASIKPSADEVWEALKVVANEAKLSTKG